MVEILEDGKKPRMFVPYNGKIADITETDTAKHTLDLETALSETRKIVSVVLKAIRITGTGTFYTYPNEGTSYVEIIWGKNGVAPIVIKDGTQNLQYALTVANDDFDLFCFGYVVEA